MEFTTTNLYEMNKQLISKEKKLGPNARKDILLRSRLWFRDSIKRYAMLLCHEKRDYTVFSVNDSPAQAALILLECIDNRGELISFEHTTDGTDAFEIWIRIDEEDYCYYLFNYDAAVIEC